MILETFCQLKIAQVVKVSLELTRKMHILKTGDHFKVSSEIKEKLLKIMHIQKQFFFISK